MELVLKCNRAIDTNQMHQLTSRDYERALDAVTDAWATHTGRDKAQAATNILKTPLGAQLYNGLINASPVPLTVGKSEPSLNTVPTLTYQNPQGRAAEAELDRLAHEEAERTGESFYRAYDRVMTTPVGKKLYASRHRVAVA
jgi:hypothetical protein